MYHATASKIRTATQAPFVKGLRFRNHWGAEVEAGGAWGASGAASCTAVPVGGIVGGAGLELMIAVHLSLRVAFTWCNSHFEYMASISPVACASDARDRLN